MYDIKNTKQKIRPEDEHKTNSPWNIAADFDVVMSFSKNEIAGMLHEYENDHHIKMNIDEIAGSKRFPDKASAWTQQGFPEAIQLLLSERNTLFESLGNKLTDDPQLCRALYALLFGGETLVYNAFDEAVNIAVMFGFVRKENGTIAVANRIFEILLYNYFLTSLDAQNLPIFKAASDHKSQFIRNGHLDMDTVMK